MAELPIINFYVFNVKKKKKRSEMTKKKKKGFLVSTVS